MRRALATLLLLAGPGCANGAYSLAYHASHGSAMAPPTTGRGTTTSLTYKEWGGPIGKLILLMATAPAPPTGTSRQVSESTTCYSTYCETTTTYEYTPPTPEEMESFQRRSEDWATNVAPAILSGAMRAEVVIDVASRSLGGDTSGGAFYLNFREQTRSLLFFQGMSLSVGMGYAHYTMHGRTRDVLTDVGGGELQLMPTSEDISYVYYGTPVRLTGLVTPRLGVYGQFDLNWQPFFASIVDEREQPQIVRGGVQLFLPFVLLTGEVAVDRFRPESITVTAEAGLAF